MQEEKKVKVLVADDEAGILDMFRFELAPEYEVFTASNGEDALTLALQVKPDVCLLDLSMPVKDGLEVCREIKATPWGKRTLIFMVTSCTEGEKVKQAYQLGVEDFIEKPFQMNVFKARLASKVERLRSKNPDELSYGNLFLNLAAQEVWLESQKLKFSTLEFRLLKFFLDNPNRKIDRQEILKRIWKKETVSERTIDSHLVAMRKRLATFDHEIATLYGAGYILRPKQLQVAGETFKVV